jgi:hypothetical protein
VVETAFAPTPTALLGYSRNGETPQARAVMTLTQYVTHRLGTTPREQAVNFLRRPLGAKSLSGFWQYWNPVWSYFLLFFCYRLLRENLPRWLSVVLTFFLCGLLHDLPFGILSYAKAGRPPYFTITVFLTLNGFLVVLSEKAGFRLTRVPTGMRWLTHVAILGACYLTAFHLTTWIATG